MQLCLVHMVRHSLERRVVDAAADRKRIYTATTSDEAEQRLAEFEAKWDDEYLPIGQSRRRNGPRLTPSFDDPAEIRTVIYTANAIESVNMRLRKPTKTRGAFPSDEALQHRNSTSGRLNPCPSDTQAVPCTTRAYPVGCQEVGV